MTQVALKKFIDGKGRRISIGDALPPDYDKTTLAHYERLGMVGEPAKAFKPARVAKPTRPAEIKPAGPIEAPAATLLAAPEFPPIDPDHKGGANNPLTLADAQADLAGDPRPA